MRSILNIIQVLQTQSLVLILAGAGLGSVQYITSDHCQDRANAFSSSKLFFFLLLFLRQWCVCFVAVLVMIRAMMCLWEECWIQREDSLLSSPSTSHRAGRGGVFSSPVLSSDSCYSLAKPSQPEEEEAESFPSLKRSQVLLLLLGGKKSTYRLCTLCLQESLGSNHYSSKKVTAEKRKPGTRPLLVWSLRVLSSYPWRCSKDYSSLW